MLKIWENSPFSFSVTVKITFNHPDENDEIVATSIKSTSSGNKVNLRCLSVTSTCGAHMLKLKIVSCSV